MIEEELDILLDKLKADNYVDYKEFCKQIWGNKMETHNKARLMADRLVYDEYANFGKTDNRYLHLTAKGHDFVGYGQQIKIDIIQQNQYDKLNKIDYQIKGLTMKNLLLQNKQLKRFAIYSIIAFIGALIIQKFEDIADFFQKLFQI